MGFQIRNKKDVRVSFTTFLRRRHVTSVALGNHESVNVTILVTGFFPPQRRRMTEGSGSFV